MVCDLKPKPKRFTHNKNPTINLCPPLAVSGGHDKSVAVFLGQAEQAGRGENSCAAVPGLLI